ncbi:MAG: (2Fe-2S)-binding protein [bacterium]|nr:(2Fe-2S)-binding protein [bacterium]
MKKTITFILNGSEATVSVDPHLRLLDVLRGPLGLTGSKEGCGEGECGACTVIVDRLAVNSCLFPAMEIEGKNVTTIEGLRNEDNSLSVIQQSFVEEGGIQCGFCSPGMIMSAKALLDANPSPDQQEIRDALLGNLCRCTGYVQIIRSVEQAARLLREGGGK